MTEDSDCQCSICGRLHRRLGFPPPSVMEQIARDMRSGDFPRKSEQTLAEEGATSSDHAPQGMQPAEPDCGSYAACCVGVVECTCEQEALRQCFACDLGVGDHTCGAIRAEQSVAPPPQSAANIEKDPRDQKLELVEGGLLLMLDAVKAGDPANEIIWRIEEELRVLRGGSRARNDRVTSQPDADGGVK